MKNIPYGRQCISESDIKEVVKVLRSDWITQGPKIKEFEDALTKYTGAKYAAAVSSGTTALHIACLAAEVKPGERILTSPITFAASANCALYVGAKPGFVDIDDKTYHMSPEALKNYLKKKSQRRGVKVVIPVHLMGTVCDIKDIKMICDKYGIKVIEDAAHAPGSKYTFGGKWLNVGNSKHSNSTIFSFHPIKHITTGEGGAILTNDKKVYEKALRLRHHGIVRTVGKPWKYDIPEVGFNFRITDFQCALGLGQLKKLNSITLSRRRLVAEYNKAFSDNPEVRIPYEKEGTRASYHLYVIRVQSRHRNKLYNYLRKNGVLAQANYSPVHLFSLYRKMGYKKGDFPVSEKYGEECLSLPLYPELTAPQQRKVISLVKRFFSNEV